MFPKTGRENEKSIREYGKQTKKEILNKQVAVLTL
jgi:hypothetical protein